MFCQRCGARLPENTAKCPHCGAEYAIDNTAAPVTVKKEAPKISFLTKKKIIIALLIVVILIVGGITATVTLSNGSSISVSTSDMLQLADRYLKEMNYEQAIIEFQKILEIEPKNVDAYIGLAEAYVALGNNDRAIEVLEQAQRNVDNEQRIEDKLAVVNGIYESEPETFESSTEPVITTVTHTTSDPITDDTVAQTTAEPVIITTVPETTSQVTTAIIETTAPAQTADQPIAPIVETTVIIAGKEYSIEYTYTLEINNTKLSNDDLINIGKLTNLTSLALVGNQITDISPLSNLSNLTGLYLNNNQITDITSLTNLTNLTMLNLENNQISDITPLAKLTNLVDLWLEDNPIPETQIAQLANQLPNCQIYSTDPTDRWIAPIAETTVMIAGVEYSIADTTKLSLYYGVLSNDDLINIGKLTNLTLLDLCCEQITDITPLAGLTNLTDLDLTGNQITDITPLAGLTNLTQLDLWGNPITDITPLVGLINLTVLNLGRNQITDISPLTGLTNLTWLELCNNQITVTQIQQLKNQLPDCQIDY